MNVTQSSIDAARAAEATDPTLLRDLAAACRRYAKQHRSADDVAAYAAVTAAACLPSTTYADAAERSRCIAYAARLAVTRAAADVAREAGDTLSLEALADAEVVVGTERLGNLRPATPRGEAIADVTATEVHAGALARIIDPAQMATIVDGHSDPIEGAAAIIAASNLPHALTYATAVTTLVALTTTEDGRELRRRGHPLTLRGALAKGTGRAKNDRSLARDEERLAEARRAARAAHLDAHLDPWHVGTSRTQQHTPQPVTLAGSAAGWTVTGTAASAPAPQRPRCAVWDVDAKATAAAARIAQADPLRLPYAPHTNVPTEDAERYPHASQVVTISTRTGRVTIDGRHVGHVGQSGTWTHVADALQTPQDRAPRAPHACPAAQPIGYAPDPAADIAPLSPAGWGAASGIAPVYAACPICDRATEQARAAERGATHPQTGAVKKPARRKKAGVGSTGPTVEAGKPADTEEQADAARARAYAV